MKTPRPVIENAVSNVPLLDLKAQYAPIRGEIESAIREVCDTQYFVMGPKVTELEAKIAGVQQRNARNRCLLRHGCAFGSAHGAGHWSWR